MELKEIPDRIAPLSDAVPLRAGPGRLWDLAMGQEGGGGGGWGGRQSYVIQRALMRKWLCIPPGSDNV